MGSGIEAPGTSNAESRIGAVLVERFELLRLLGSGSYGDVYETRDRQNPNTPLALKLLRRPGANALYRFKREFRSLAEVSHPNLVALHELFLDDGDAFFTMDLVPGGDVLSYVRPGGVLDAERLRQALRGLAAGVSALHELGRLHRDLKPDNVLVGGAGHVVIVDFGLASVLDDRERGELGFGFAGTPLYAAPEQLAGCQNSGPDSDWYAVGTMLYKALSGRLPYAAPWEELAQAKQLPPAPLPDLPPTLQSLGELCLRMLAPARAVRDGEAELRAALGDFTTAAARTRASRPVALIGRGPEIAQLAESFAQVETVARACAVVIAPSGLGKTALVEHFLAELRASQRALVLCGRCYVNEDVAYRAVDGLVDALSRHLLGLTAAEASALLPRDVRALAQLFPVLLRVPAIAAAVPSLPPNPEDEASARERGARVLRELLARICDRLPLVLFIDDVQWDDADSAWLITELLADPDPPSLLFVLACRSDAAERSHVLRALRRDPALAQATRDVALAPLGHDAALALATSALASSGATPDPALLARIADESAGHPMFTLELARWALASDASRSTPGALSLDSAIRARAENLAGPARRLLELACAAGHRLTLSAALRACGAEAPALRELAARKLVSSTGSGAHDTLETSHDRVREAVLDAMPAARVRAFRGRLADVLTQESAPRFDLIVEHYLASGQRARAAVYATEAAEHAMAVLAFHRVPGLLELAIAHAEPAQRGSLFVRLGRAYSLVGRTRDASRALRAAAELEPDPEQRWELRRMAMWQALQEGDVELGLSLLRELDRPFGLRGVYPTWGRLLFSSALMLWWRIAGRPALRQPDLNAAHASFDAKRLRLVWSATTGLVTNQFTWLAHFMVLGMRLSARLGDASVYAPLLASFSAAPGTLSGRPSEAAEAGIAQAMALARTRGDTSAIQTVLLTQALYLGCTDQTARAAAAVEAALELPFAPTEVGTHLRFLVRGASVVLCFLRGSLAYTRDRASAWIGEAREHAAPRVEHSLRAMAAYRFLCDDDVERAVAEWWIAQARYPELDVLRDPVCGMTVGLYSGRLDVAERAFAHAQRTFWRWNAHVAGSRAGHLWAWGQLAAAQITAGEPKLRARLVLRCAIWCLRMQRARSAAPMLQHLLAAHAYLHGRSARGLAHLQRSRALFAERGQRLFAACADHALSVLHPEQSARAAHATAARELFEAEGVRRPARWVRALLPGLPDVSPR